MEDLGVQFWIGVVFQIVGVAAVVVPSLWRLLIQPMQKDLDGYGKRLNHIASECTAHEADINNLKNAANLSQADNKNLHEKLGEFKASVERFINQLETDRRDGSKGEQQILQRLSSIEAKLHLGNELKEAFTAIMREKKNDS